MSCVLKRRKKRKEKLMERETPRQQQQHRDHHCHSETSELKNKNVLQSREREASHITDRTPDLSKMLQNFILKLFVILQLSAGRLGVLKESNQQLKDKTDTRQRAGKYGSELQLISFSVCQQRRANDAIVHSDGRRALTFGVNDVQGTLCYRNQVTVFMVNEGSSCDLRATFNWTVTFVQVGFSISLSSQRCVYTLVRKHHGLTWLNLLVGMITDGDAPTSCEKQLVLVAAKNIQDITEAVGYQQEVNYSCGLLKMFAINKIARSR